MNIFKSIFVGLVISIMASVNAHAVVVDVFAKANSSSGGIGKVTGINIGVGDLLVMVTGVNDCWSAGADPRNSNADGLVPSTPCPNQGIPNFGNWVQDLVSAPYGSLMGKIGSGDFFFVGTNFNQIMTEAGGLSLFYWDSFSGDNSGHVSVNISVRAAQTPDLPEPGVFGLLMIGLGMLLFRRRA